MIKSNKPSLSSDFINVDNLTLEQGDYTEETALLLHCLEGVGEVSGDSVFTHTWIDAKGLYSRCDELSDTETAHLDRLLESLYTWNDRMDAYPS